MKCAAHVILIAVYLLLISRIDMKGSSTFYISNMPHNIIYFMQEKPLKYNDNAVLILYLC